MLKKLNKKFPEPKFGLELFILGNSCDFAIHCVFFVCFFFGIEK